MPNTRIVAPALLAMLLASCGFHLRGEVRLPAGTERIMVEASDPASPLKRDLEAALKRSGSDVRSVAGEGVATLKLPTIQLATEPVSISSQARVKEYRVRYKVEVELTGADGKVLLARAALELTRDYSFDETQALGAQAEEDLIKKELERDMVQQVLRKIESIASQK
jgi:LPS-assembly lipoprotein